MTDHDDFDGREERDSDEAFDRLLDVLIAEELREDAAATSITRPEPAPSPEPEPEPEVPAGYMLPPLRRRPWLAAAALLGIAVVFATAWLSRTEDDAPPFRFATPRQDPGEREQVEVRDVEHLRKLLRTATGVRMTRKEVTGAAREETPNHSADTLVTRPWPERYTCRDGGTFAIWRRELLASVDTQERQSSGTDFVDLDIELPGDRRITAFASIHSDPVWFSIHGMTSFVATPELTRLLNAAGEDIDERHRLARGNVKSLAELQDLPATCTRLEVPVDETTTPTAIAALQRFARLRTLVLRGDVPAPALAAVARLDIELETLHLVGVELGETRHAALREFAELQGLVLEGCTDFDTASIHALQSLRRLRSLRCIDTPMGEEGELLAELVALPALREFGLRQRGLALVPEALEVINRTRIDRLMLVDVEAPGETLAVLRDAPTLRELIVVNGLHDHDAEPLQRLTQLQHLRLRNTKITIPAAEELRNALPDCEVDWQLDGRFFQTRLAFEIW